MATNRFVLVCLIGTLCLASLVKGAASDSNMADGQSERNDIQLPSDGPDETERHEEHTNMVCFCIIRGRGTICHPTGCDQYSTDITYF